MEYTTKLMYQSNYWYNDGLKKANIRDMSGAVTSLRRSLQYNRGNIAARNLLGLVYYGRGDVVEALVEWILSKNFQSEDNIANYYISKIQEVPGELESINQAVKLFNQSIELAGQNGEDLAIIQLKKAIAAHPSYVKAHQLLALLYIQTEQFSAARKELRTAHKLDTTDETTLRYMHEITQIRKSRPSRARDRGKGGEERHEQTVTYNIGNETIIQPASSVFKENSGLHTFLNIAVGVLVGAAVMWFLIMPAVSVGRQKKLNERVISFSDKIATQEAQISALKTELEEYRANSEESEDLKEKSASTQESYEIVLSVAKHFAAEDMSDKEMLEQMLKVSPESLGESGKSRYEEVAASLFPRMCEKLYGTAGEEYESGDYDGAISSLEKVVKMDEGYQDGKALLLLAQSFEKKGEQDKANIRYQKLVEKYKGKEAAGKAQKALDGQNTKGGRDAKAGQDDGATQGDGAAQDDDSSQDDEASQDDEGGQDDEASQDE